MSYTNRSIVPSSRFIYFEIIRQPLLYINSLSIGNILDFTCFVLLCSPILTVFLIEPDVDPKSIEPATNLIFALHRKYGQIPIIFKPQPFRGLITCIRYILSSEQREQIITQPVSLGVCSKKAISFSMVR